MIEILEVVELAIEILEVVESVIEVFKTVEVSEAIELS